jgi:hypothetical protein
MSEVYQIQCPEHDQTEIIEVEHGQITWCSRVAGRPVCAGTCLSQVSEVADRAQELSQQPPCPSEP